jgi:G3E family GTPase
MAPRATAAPKEPIHLTVIGGFLGAGKTTLLNQLLRDPAGRRLAVLVNDFGAINIDAELIQSRDGEILSLENGCICCGVAGDFIAALALLRDREDPPEHVIVEASGVADPGAIVALGDMPGYRRDAAVVVADAETVRERAEDELTRHQVRGQLRAADLIVLNKTDLVDAEHLADTRTWVREVVGESTAIVEAAFGAVPTDVVLGITPKSTADAGHHAEHAHEHDHDHAHGAPHASFDTWSWRDDTAISGAALVEAIKALPGGVVRAKGLLYLREDAAHRYVMQVVGRRYSVQLDRAWGDETPASQLVIIGLPGSIDEQHLTDTLDRLTVPAA